MLSLSTRGLLPFGQSSILSFSAPCFPVVRKQCATWRATSVTAMADKPRIILGSASRTRREILTELGFEFEIKKAGIDESAIRKKNPKNLVTALAEAKAEAIKKKLLSEGFDFSTKTTTLLITADQVVVHENRILEKPKNEAEAREFISGYSRSPPGTVGSVLVTNLRTGRTAIGVDATEVHFRPIPIEVIDKLVLLESTYESAGGLMVEHPLVEPLIERMVGSLDSVMGLSKTLTLSLIEQVL